MTKGRKFFERNGLIWSSDLPSTERFILMALNEFADQFGTNCYPGQNTLAEMTGYNRRTVSRALDSMKEKNIVAWISNGKKHARTATNNYQINFNLLKAKFQRVEAEDHKPPCDTGSQGKDEGCDPVSVGLRSTITPPCDPVSHDLLNDLPSGSASRTQTENSKSTGKDFDDPVTAQFSKKNWRIDGIGKLRPEVLDFVASQMKQDGNMHPKQMARHLMLKLEKTGNPSDIEALEGYCEDYEAYQQLKAESESKRATVKEGSSVWDEIGGAA